MKRTPIIRRTALKTKVAIRRGKPMRSRPRPLTAAEKAWQAAVLAIRFCVLCGHHGVQWCHRDQGKGMGQKTHPSQTAALCPDCHRELTDGTKYTRERKREIMDLAIDETHHRIGAATIHSLETRYGKQA